MSYPVSTTFVVLSGSLSILDRYSAYGVAEPSVHVDNPDFTPGSNLYEFVWDFVDTAVHVTSYYHEMSLSGSIEYNCLAYGSNDGATWTLIPSGAGSIEISGFGTDAVLRHVQPLSIDKWFRYVKMVYEFTSQQSLNNLRFQTANFTWDSARPWTSDGNGGVGPGGDGGGANDPGGENDPSTHEGFAMSDLSVYAGDMFLNWIKGTPTDSPPDHVFVALFDGDPDNSGVELTNTAGLTRPQVTFGSIVNRYMLNTTQLQFGDPTEEVTVSAFALYDAASGGNRLTRKMLAIPSTFSPGTQIIIQPGKLPVYY